MESTFSTFDSLSFPSASTDVLQLTISPAETTLKADDLTPGPKDETPKPEEKKPVKKRKSWGQELPTPKTNLPPRKRAKTEDEKEQRRIERVLRNRAAAQISRERKRLEIEKLETEKAKMEQQNQFLLQRLAQMEAENNRLSQQVAKLSTEIRSSRGSPPQSVSVPSPTLAPVLFKQEQDDLSMEKLQAFTPPLTAYSPSVTVDDSIDTSDLTQHPAAVLCDLQCQSEESMNLLTVSPQQSSTPSPLFPLVLHIIWQHLYLTMTSAAFSTVILPLSQVFHSLKKGSPLTFSQEEISQHLPLILWLISTPNLLKSSPSSQRSIFRVKLLTRLLACSPALARPLRDATSKALQLAVRDEQWPGNVLSKTRGDRLDQEWELLMTTIWAIDRLGRSHNKVSKPSRGLHATARSAHNARAKEFLSSRSRSSRSTMGYGQHRRG